MAPALSAKKPPSSSSSPSESILESVLLQASLQASQRAPHRSSQAPFALAREAKPTKVRHPLKMATVGQVIKQNSYPVVC
ncbi:MAG: hypothetical protein LBU32_31065 [Clostridiales bacterium]|jgi:hypothetical protein|nr:hypothetical protein [Clostridiales bacterium]